MANPSCLINGIQYASVPEVDIPKVGSGTAKFYYTGDSNGTAADLRNGKKMFGATGEVTGSMAEKSAASYNPATADQTINASQYLTGAQTIRAVTISGLSASVIASGVTVKVGCSADDDCVGSWVGTLASPVISQDSTTKILSIS